MGVSRIGVLEMPWFSSLALPPALSLLSFPLLQAGNIKCVLQQEGLELDPRKVFLRGRGCCGEEGIPFQKSQPEVNATRVHEGIRVGGSSSLQLLPRFMSPED